MLTYVTPSPGYPKYPTHLWPFSKSKFQPKVWPRQPCYSCPWPMSAQKNVSPFDPAVWPAIGNIYTNVLFYYIDYFFRFYNKKNKAYNYIILMSFQYLGIVFEYLLFWILRIDCMDVFCFFVLKYCNVGFKNIDIFHYCYRLKNIFFIVIDNLLLMLFLCVSSKDELETSFAGL